MLQILNFRRKNAKQFLPAVFFFSNHDVTIRPVEFLGFVIFSVCFSLFLFFKKILFSCSLLLLFSCSLFLSFSFLAFLFSLVLFFSCSLFLSFSLFLFSLFSFLFFSVFSCFLLKNVFSLLLSGSHLLLSLLSSFSKCTQKRE